MEKNNIARGFPLPIPLGRVRSCVKSKSAVIRGLKQCDILIGVGCRFYKIWKEGGDTGAYIWSLVPTRFMRELINEGMIRQGRHFADSYAHPKYILTTKGRRS